VLEGWPAGLRLAALSLRAPTDLTAAIAAVGNSHGGVMDYLFSEIYANLPEGHREWLLQIAILDRFCAPLCVTICERSKGSEDPAAGQAFVAWLQAANLFLVPLDDQGLWFRFHHLFLQLLRYRQQAHYDSAALAVLHTRAAAWFAGAGLVEDALRHALAAGALDQALVIFSQARQVVLNQEDWPRLQRWLDLFPAAFVAQTPELLIARAWVLHNQFRSAEVEQLLDAVEGKRAMSGATTAVAAPDPLEADIACLRAMASFWRAEDERCLLLTQRVLEIAPSTDTMVRGCALMYLGVATQLVGRQAAGFARLQDEYSHATGRDAAMEARLLTGLTAMEWVACDLSAATRIAGRLLKLGEEHRLLASRAWGHYYLGCVHYLSLE
jgi:LuxR family maltose regulon positive regulatory protein